jgi:hypothetical protein
MMKLAKLAVTFVCMPALASAQPGAELDDPAWSNPIEQVELRPPSTVVPPAPRVDKSAPFATTRLWGGGIRLTGLSGIGALPGVNYGAEVAGLVRYGEFFGELGLGWWKPEKTYIVTAGSQHTELGLDVWTLRGGWASMHTPLRAWVLVEAGDLASSVKGMPGVIPRMVMGDMAQGQRWTAAGAGFGVAWPMSDNARLFGMIEFAVPFAREQLMLDQVGTYEPDAMVARSSLGLEVGWR